MLDVLYSLLNTRYNRKKVTIATSNFEDEPDPASGERERLEDRIGYRLRSRLYEMCLMVPAAGRRLPQGRPGHPDPVPVLRERLPTRRARVLLFGLGWTLAAACTTTKPAPPPPLPSAAEAPVPVPAMRVALPETPSRSGVLYRVGLKSDLTELSIGSAGTLWIVASGERAELLQGPVVFRPSLGARRRRSVFQVQAGAFSQEEPARRLAERLVLHARRSGRRSRSRRIAASTASCSEASPRARRRTRLLEKLKASGAGRLRRSRCGPARGRRCRGGDDHRDGSGGPALALASPVDIYGPAPEVRVAVDGDPTAGACASWSTRAER